MTVCVPFVSFSPEPWPTRSLGVDVGVHADRDAADGVGHDHHAREVDHHEVVDVEPVSVLPGGHRAAGAAAAQRRRSSSPRGGRVHFPVSGSVHFGDGQQRVARHAHHRHVVAVGGHVHQHLDVRAAVRRRRCPWRRRASGSPRCHGVRADQQDVQRGLARRVRLGFGRLGVADVALVRLDVAVEVLGSTGSPPPRCRVSARRGSPADQRSITSGRLRPARGARRRAVLPVRGRAAASARRRPRRALSGAHGLVVHARPGPGHRPAGRGRVPSPRTLLCLIPTPPTLACTSAVPPWSVRRKAARLVTWRTTVLSAWRTAGCPPDALAGAGDGVPGPLKSLPRVSVIVGSPWWFVSLLPGFIAGRGQPHDVGQLAGLVGLVGRVLQRRLRRASPARCPLART